MLRYRYLFLLSYGLAGALTSIFVSPPLWVTVSDLIAIVLWSALQLLPKRQP